MTDDEKLCRGAIDNGWRDYPWDVITQMRYDAHTALDRVLASARAEGFAKAREMAGVIAESQPGGFCATAARLIRAMQNEGER
jgi:hypothetical protein